MKRILAGLRFVLYPVAFFAVILAALVVVGQPIVAPLVPVISALALESAPDFDAPTVDLYVDKVEESLPVSNERIVVPSADLPAYGDRYGQVICEAADIDVPLYFGDSKKELRKGAGTYNGAYIPGAGRTIIIAAHRDTHFRRLGDLREGDIIRINTSYGIYQYAVVGWKISTDTDAAAYDLSREEENLILYTCYPFYYVGMAPNRYFVYAAYVSGPQIGPMH